MKKNSFVSRILTMCLAALMMLGTSVPAFAAETTTVEENNATSAVEVVAPGEETTVMPRQAQYWSDFSPKQSYGFNVPLQSYIGLSKTFHVSVDQLSSPAGGAAITGKVHCVLKRVSDGTVMGEWDLTYIGSSMKQFTLPKSGDYTLSVTNNTNITVRVTGQWV